MGEGRRVVFAIDNSRRHSTRAGGRGLRENVLISKAVMLQYCQYSLLCLSLLLLHLHTCRAAQEESRGSPREEAIQQSTAVPAANPTFEAAFQGECGKNNNSNPCEHICLDLHDGTYECSCFYGFALAVDGYSCAAVQRNWPANLSEPARPKFDGPSAPGEPDFKPPPKPPGGLIGARQQEKQHKRANDNRKLADEREEGNEIGQVGGNEAGLAPSDSTSESRRPASSNDSSDDYSEYADDSDADASSLDTGEPIRRQQQPQTTTISGRSPQNSGRNKGAARDKWPSYDVLVDSNLRLDLDSGEQSSIIELSDGMDDLQDAGELDAEEEADIRSIIGANDRLVSRLADSIARTENELSGRTGKGQADVSGAEAANADSGPKRRQSLELLRKLVGKTIEDYADAQPTAPPGPRRRRLGLRPKKTRSPAPPPTGHPLDLDKLSSPSQTANNRCFSGRDKHWPIYADCHQLPECESGGRCAIDTTRSGRREKYARCRCPIGRGGFLCQKPVQRATPRFTGHSYLALPMLVEPTLRSLRLLLRPDMEPSQVGRRARLVLYSQRFVLLLDDMNRVELRYFSAPDARSPVTRVIGSRDVQPDTWLELLVTDDDNQLAPPADHLPRVVLVLPEVVPIANSSTELFVAGLPEALQTGSGALSEPLVEGFRGCISELSINGRVYNFRSDLNGDALDGFDITECCHQSQDAHSEA